MAWIGFTIAWAAVCAISYPLIRLKLIRLRASHRAMAIATWAAMPPVAGVLLTGICFLPSSLSLAGLSADHCLDHGDGHTHICLNHGPESSGLTAAGIAIATLVPLTALLARELREYTRLRRLLSMLELTSRKCRNRDIRVLDTPIPLAFAAFLIRPRVFISSALITSLPQQLLDVVIEHERAHVRRRDRFIRAIVSLLSGFYTPRIRTRLIEDLSLACEQACDEEAAARVGDRLRVASAILAVERMRQELPALPSLAGSSFGGSNIALRVFSLVQGAVRPPASGRHWIWVGVALAGLTLLASDTIHHAAETILTPFTR